MNNVVRLSHDLKADHRHVVAPRHSLAEGDGCAGSPAEVLGLLIGEIAKGDERAFARLYELTGGRLMAVAFGIVGRRDAAEDVLQESFVRVWRSAHQYVQDKGVAFAWLVTIVRNRALSVKATLRKHEQGRAQLDSETLLTPDPDAFSQFQASEAARRVRGCLERLPSNHRRSIRLVYFEGLTHVELARKLEVPVGTAKGWVRSGLAQMQRCLTGRGRMEWRESVAADYAVGSMQGPARRGFERRRERDARYCLAADQWENDLALLVEFLPWPGHAPKPVWDRIRRRIRRERVALSSWRGRLALIALLSLLLVLTASRLSGGSGLLPH